MAHDARAGSVLPVGRVPKDELVDARSIRLTQVDAAALRAAYRDERHPEVRRAMAVALVTIDPGFDDGGEAGLQGERVRVTRTMRDGVEAALEVLPILDAAAAPERGTDAAGDEVAE